MVVDERCPERFCRATVATTDFELFRVKLAAHIPKQSGDGDDACSANTDPTSPSATDDEDESAEQILQSFNALPPDAALASGKFSALSDRASVQGTSPPPAPTTAAPARDEFVAGEYDVHTGPSSPALCSLTTTPARAAVAAEQFLPGEASVCSVICADDSVVSSSQLAS